MGLGGAILGGSAITAGAGLIGASNHKGQPNIQNVFTPGPEAAAGHTATADWLNQLTQDQNDPTGNFGAISPDWNDIWAQTQKQVQQYFNGSATNPGVNDQIKASFAQRGMSGDPASSFLLSASGANEASDLSNLGAQMNIAKQQFSQKGKENWLNSISQLQNQTANAQSGGSWSGGVASPTPTQQIANMIGTTGNGIAAYGLQQQSNQNQLNWLNSLSGNLVPLSVGSAPSNTAPSTPFFA